ncbi:MAG: 3'-5' exonuclease, partial [Burkholderiaceae bacterium]
AHDHASTIWELMQDDSRLLSLSQEGQQRLGFVRQVFSEAFAQEGRQRPRRWVEGVWQSLGGPLCLQQPSDLLDVDAFFTVLDSLERRGQLDIAELEAELGKLYAAPDPSAEFVQIMTIHKSKGLEFDTVILPALQKSARLPDKPLLVWDEVIVADGREELVVAAIPKKGASDAPSKYEFLREFEKSRTANENQRLLYVAVTRAVRQLHLLGIAKPDPKEKEGLLKAPSKSAFLHLLWDQVRPEFETAARAVLEADTSAERRRMTIDAATFVPKLTRLAKPMLHLALTDYASGTGLAKGIADDADEPNVSTPANLETDIGTLVHRYLEMIATDGLDAWPVSRIEDAQARFKQWFEIHGYGPQECSRATDDVKNNLVSAVSSTTGRWILGPHASAECEAGITTTENGVSRSHIVDRTFIENGTRWVIDYKTTRYKGEDLEVFLKERAESYREQMVRYASLDQSAGQALKVAIYFVSEDRHYEFNF